MLNRSITPPFGKITSIHLIEPTVYHLDNGLPVFAVSAGTQEVLKIELIFHAGTATADKKLVASASSKLQTEGTTKRTAMELAEAVDFYGAHLQSEVTHDEASLDLYTLNKHVDNTIGTLAEVYSDPVFEEREVETYLLKSKQEMLVNEEKVSYLGAKAFSASLFGKEHPYGRSANQQDYDAVSRHDLVGFHSSFIKSRIKYILVSGKLSSTTIQSLNQQFGQEKRLAVSENAIPINAIEPMALHVEKPGAVQNSIKIGRVLFNRTHSDFVGMQILSTVLGGYFGSRLMTNIREDKGYTYGIGAGLVSLKDTGYLSISTEVGADTCEAAVNEIFIEIERLRKEPIPIHELELVQNYMLGSILKSLDGPFQISDKWKTYLRYGLGSDSHYSLIRQILNITPERLRELANTYLQRKDLVQVTVGKPI
ncbi:MAG: insulinase family protein [Flavobacteriales bacterium]|nr:insulinase family protein [Flavobacteriales bacterium]